jgi:hypothetical protein
LQKEGKYIVYGFCYANWFRGGHQLGRKSRATQQKSHEKNCQMFKNKKTNDPLWTTIQKSYKIK